MSLLDGFEMGGSAAAGALLAEDDGDTNGEGIVCVPPVGDALPKFRHALPVEVVGEIGSDFRPRGEDSAD